MENYARTYGINRKKWLTPFTRGEPEQAAQCELLRKRLMEPLARARAGIVNARDTRASLEAVMGLMMVYSDQMMLIDEFQKHFDNLWEKMNAGGSSKRSAVETLRDIREQCATHLLLETRA